MPVTQSDQHGPLGSGKRLPRGGRGALALPWERGPSLGLGAWAAGHAQPPRKPRAAAACRHGRVRQGGGSGRLWAGAGKAPALFGHVHGQCWAPAALGTGSAGRGSAGRRRLSSSWTVLQSWASAGEALRGDVYI